MIRYVQFKSMVNVGGKHTAIESWTREKHGEEIELVERGNWLHLTTRTGRFRVPMSNVGYIWDDGVDEPPRGKEKP